MARLLFFGRLGDLAGHPEETIDLPGNVTDTAALRTWLESERGYCGALLEPSVRLAVNDEIVSEPHAIRNTDEIAFMPPVGGG